MPENRTNPTPFILAFIGLVVVACLRQQSSAPTRPPAPKDAKAAHRPVARKPETEASADAQAPAKVAPHRVILVTLDGWHVRLTDRMPVWKEMTAAGSWTLDAEVPKGATTVISHAALYTGADPKVNGVTRELENKNGLKHVHGWRFRWKPFMKVADDGTVTFTVKDTLFTATEAAGYEAMAVVQKGKLVGLFRPDGDDAGISLKNDKGLIQAACAAVENDDLRLVILHIGSPDGAGHDHGWLSDEQYAVAEKVSDQLQSIRTCMAEAEKTGGVPTTLIVTTDHGGTPVESCMRKHNKARCGHGADDADNRRVPWVAIGPGIKAGHEIQADVRLVDTAPTILRILGIPSSSIPTLSGSEVSEIFERP